MKSKFLSVLLAIAATLTFSAFAQTGSAATPSPGLPNAPSAAPATAPIPTGPGKVGSINIQDAIFACNEGRLDMDALQKKYEPKQTELKTQNDELDSLKKQLDTQGSKLNEDDRAVFKRMPITRQERLLKIQREYPESVPRDLPDPFAGPQREALWRLSYSTRAGIRLRAVA